MKLSLVVMAAGKAEGKVIPITLSQFVIGRDPQCNLRPASAIISKRHCAILQRDGKVFVRDFESTNGTQVNDVPVKGEAELKHDDRLKVGPLLFAVKIEASAPVNRPTPPPPAKKPAEGQSDDDIAAMLLSLQDDGAAGSASVGADGVPEGSTVMEMMVPQEGEPQTVAEAQQANKAKEHQKAKQAQASTSNAAKEILEKYMRRPRGGA